ncbi:hypothetical protein O181_033117 [Austropuccinia psidii MF-1]|uniref:O-methyltransferase C-terminal domain-containing protein n=1 Tax=Austropuccinia psidii MF-1 TaxID=1389203 RepID=A0A9Q3D0S9_9BASI|nr:hypothetical protein [Austropuccinia psidii MF-1]
MPSSQAQKLVALIAQAVDDIEADTASQIPGGATTDLNLPIIAPEDDLEANPKRLKAIENLQAATHQLLATLLPAGFQICQLHFAALQTVALDVVIKGKIADHINAIDPNSSKGGAHINVLAEKAEIESSKLSQILRFLAIRNVFCELTENHWANNRMSFPLRSDSKNSLVNLLGHARDDIALPALVELPNILFKNEDSYRSAWAKYHKCKTDIFDHLKNSEGGWKAVRLGKAMIESSNALATGQSHYKGFDWKTLPPKGTLIDVGGGTGVASYGLAGYLPQWKIVVQDRPEVVQFGIDHYQKLGSQANIEFEVHDFFKPQPSHRIQTSDAYFLRNILDIWPEQEGLKILTLLRKAAKPSTVLLLCETKIDPPLVEKGSVLLANGGMATSISHYFDVTMMLVCNSRERSLREYKELLEKSGWKFENLVQLTTISQKYIFKAVPNSDWKADSTGP